MDLITTEEQIDIKTEARIPYLDNVRALAMMIGVIFHASLAYSPLMHNFWLTAEQQQSEWIDVVAWFLHLFRMPVFFIISGFFVHLLLEKKGIKGMLKNRLFRVFVPFLVFMPLILIAMGLLITFAITNVANPSPIVSFIISASKMPNPPPPQITTVHLWFLYQLTFFCVLIVGLHKLKVIQWISKVMSNYPLWFVFLFPLLLVPAFYSQSMPHPAPESFMPQLWSFGLYGLLFVVGFAWYQSIDFLEKIEKYIWLFLGLGVILYACFYPIFPKTVDLLNPVTLDTNVKVVGAFLEAYIAVLMSFATLIIGKRYLNQNSPVVRYIADASYWIYIVHLPLLFLIQFYLLDVSWNLWVEFLVSSVLTLAIGMLSYVLLVRWTFIGRMLNGKAKKITL